MSDADKDEAQQHILNEVRDRNLSHRILSSVQSSTNKSHGTSSTKLMSKTDIQLDAFLIGCGLDPPQTSSTGLSSNKTIREELAFYTNALKTRQVFEEFWTTHEKDLPCLSTLVRSFNIRPVTSVASESLFSIASYVHRKQRSSLSPTTLRYSMLLRDAELLASLL